MFRVFQDYLRRADMPTPIIRNVNIPNSKSRSQDGEFDARLRRLINHSDTIILEDPMDASNLVQVCVLIRDERTMYVPLTLDYVEPSATIEQIYSSCFPCHPPVRYEEYVYINQGTLLLSSCL